MEPKQILMVTPNEAMVSAFKNAFLRYNVDIHHVSTYTEALPLVQERSMDLVITEYFLESCDDKESRDEAFSVRNWEIDLLESDMEFPSLYQDDLMWFRSLISKKDKEKLFPLGRRLSIVSDLFMVKNVLLLAFEGMNFYRGNLDGVALYLNGYGRPIYKSSSNPVITSEEFIKFIEKAHIIEMEKVF